MYVGHVQVANNAVTGASPLECSGDFRHELPAPFNGSNARERSGSVDSREARAVA